MFVPLMAPHWVKNGPAVSISFSVTWRSDWTYAVADAHAMNAVLRKTGLNPAFPGRYPGQNRTKALACTAPDGRPALKRLPDGPAARPGPLEVVAAEPARNIDRLADRVEPRHFARFHRL